MWAHSASLLREKLPFRLANGVSVAEIGFAECGDETLGG